MGGFYLDDHIAEDHLHTGITTCNIEEAQQKYNHGTVRNRLIGGRFGEYKHVLLDPNLGLFFRNGCYVT